MVSLKRSGYHLPNKEIISTVIMIILNEATTVRSQTRFHRLVLLKLREMEGGNLKLSAQRLRRIAAKMENVDMIIHCRDGSRNFRRVYCPVCSTAMDDIKNSTLYGWTVSTGKRCPICGYWAGTRERIPIRYVFTIEKERYIRETLNGKDEK
ncbi:MAG: hypothetical protein U9R75_05940 [Candidatus Thermoplasmatota archaeon]|nr:hypothetical protein [Candidatus Thermoplasmatota archaeon]